MIIFVIVKAIQNYERPAKLKDSLEAKQMDGDVEPERAPGELPADVYLARARELAAEGKFQEAIAHLLLGAMSHIERAGLIKFRRGLTYRDYLRAIRSKETPYRGMRSLVRFYEPIGFGRRDATQETFTQSLTGYEAAIHAGAVAVQS